VDATEGALLFTPREINRWVNRKLQYESARRASLLASGRDGVGVPPRAGGTQAGGARALAEQQRSIRLGMQLGSPPPPTPPALGTPGAVHNGAGASAARWPAHHGSGVQRPPHVQPSTADGSSDAWQHTLAPVPSGAPHRAVEPLNGHAGHAASGGGAAGQPVGERTEAHGTAPGEAPLGLAMGSPAGYKNGASTHANGAASPGAQPAWRPVPQTLPLQP
jgi:hypothetical protein